MERPTHTLEPADARVHAPTANDRLKQSFGARLWSSLIVATGLHFAVFSLWPTMSVVEVASATDGLEHIEIPPELDVPDPPAEVRRPAHPEVGNPDVDPDLTIGRVDFESNPPGVLPPPPARADSRSATVPFTPYTVAPRLTNAPAVQRTLEREYPSLLRNAGIGGNVTVHLHVDEEGVVRESRVFEGSGYDAMDAAALKVAGAMRFSPALNRDVRVAVWVQQTITFTVR